MSITLKQAQAELTKKDLQIAELQKQNAKLQAAMQAFQAGAKRSVEYVSSDVATSNKKAKITGPTSDQIVSQSTSVTRKVQGQISSKLKWKPKTFPYMKGTGNTKGARVEVVCKHPHVFEHIFRGTAIKKGKDGKLSCSFKTQDEVYRLPFHAPSYRYSSASLRAPCSASYKEGALIFSFKYRID